MIPTHLDQEQAGASVVVFRAPGASQTKLTIHSAASVQEIGLGWCECLVLALKRDPEGSPPGNIGRNLRIMVGWIIAGFRS